MRKNCADSAKIQTVLPVYLPWLLSVALQLLPELSYLVAWLGSFYIFYFTLHSRSPFLDTGLPWLQQLMRPIILIQIVFAGFMCCSSIFYFLDHHDFYYLGQMSDRIDPPEGQIYRIAECQRLCLLAHCALVTGMYVSPKHRAPAYQLNVPTDFLLGALSLSSLLFIFILAPFPGTTQVSLMLLSLQLFSGTLLLVRSMKRKHFVNFILGACIFLISLGNNLFTGYKESIIVHFVLLGCLLYPMYAKQVKFILLPIALAIFIFLPSFTTGIRKLAWTDHRKAASIQQIAYLSLLDPQSERLADNNWQFLTSRFSEIGMFTQFIKKVPAEHPYYGWKIFLNSIQALVPRVFWPAKPSTEKIAMKRVYELGIANRASSVSAKSRPVVDGYLSDGPIGVFVAIFTYGFLAQSICNTAERWFGGYTLGCTVMFNGLFQQLWRGNNFEFILNNIAYGFLIMTLIFYLLRIGKILIPQIKTSPRS